MSLPARLMLAGGLFVLVLLVSIIANSGGGCSVTLASGRTVVANSDTLWVSASNDEDTSHLSLGLLNVDVEPAQVVVEGHPLVDLDAQAKSVLITRADGQLTVVADGATVYDGPTRR